MGRFNACVSAYDQVILEQEVCKVSKRIFLLVLIFLCTSAAWIILSQTIKKRTHSQDTKLKSAVGELWGTVQRQDAPAVYFTSMVGLESADSMSTGGESKIEPFIIDRPLSIEKSDIRVELELDHRKKGLLWYSTYKVSFSGSYMIKNPTNQPGTVDFKYVFPSRKGIYDNFKISINGDSLKELQPSKGVLICDFELDAHESKVVNLSFKSQGMDEWWYVFGAGVTQLQNFRLTMQTNFDDINFPGNSISPTLMSKTDNGWELIWDYESLISGIQIGMDLPQKLNPGPFVSRVSYFAPVSLFFFFFLMFIITTLRKIDIHPMNYFFLAAAFFAFHLLLAYLVDHIDVHAACLISSAVSIFLVISYMRLAAGLKFALLETGLSQFVYLVLFSYAFFLEGYTGLTITVMSIITLFVVMQFTGRINWNKYMPVNRQISET